MEYVRRITVKLPRELHKRLKRQCVDDDTQMSNTICELVKQELDRRERQRGAKATKSPRSSEARAV